jgi:hypothetical protein
MSKPFQPGETPNRATTLPTDPAARKEFPVGTGVLDYFPDALVAIAEVSKKGNDQHNPGEPLHWARGKSMDQDDTIIRHYLERGTIDPTDGMRHSAKMAWRVLALLQLEIEEEQRAAQFAADVEAIQVSLTERCNNHLAVGDGKDFRCLRNLNHSGGHYYSGGSK